MTSLLSLDVVILFGIQSGQSARLFLQSSEMGPPTPSPVGECVSPPLVPGGGTHSLGARGPNSEEGTDTLVLLVNMYTL